MEVKPLSQKQRQSILEAKARLNLWEGSVRSGKTVASILAWLIYVVKYAPPGNLLMAGKTERTLRRNILDVISEIVDPGDYHLNSGLGELTLYGRKIYLVGANDERSESKIRGVSLAGAYCDELTLFPESFFQMLLSRLSIAGARLFGTTNPDTPAHWLKKNYLDREDALDLRHWHFVLEDNLSLDPAYISALKSEYTGLWYQRYILGLWVVAEGAVYHFVEDQICTNDPPKTCDRYHVAIDYGITNPTHFLLFGRSNNIWYILKEWRWDSAIRQRQKTDLELSHDLGRFLEWHGQKIIPETVDIDPSATSFIVQTRQDFPNLDIRYAINPVLEGIRTTSSALAKGDLKINRSECPLLLEEMSGYCWDSKAQEKGEDVPLKMADHACDCIRYGAMRVFRYS